MREKSLLSRFNDWWWETTNRQTVVKDLADTRWDWLRTSRGLGFLIALSVMFLYLGPVLVWFVDDGFGLLPLALAGGVFGLWFLLRRAVRLVADAPDEALDERLIAIRNRVYLSAYRSLVTVIGFLLVGLLIWSLWSDTEGTISATLALTWPQANAVVWFVFGQILLLPSLVLASAIRMRKVRL
jgi:hypothetical protein